MSSSDRAQLIDRFHQLYYDIAEHEGGTWKQTSYLGIETWKCPLDMWVYQEMLHETRPDLIIETGTHRGGSALYLAHVCDLLGTGSILTVDIQPHPGKPEHPRVSYHHGSSLADDFLGLAAERAAAAGTVMVILDSDHTADHVHAEMEALAGLVTPGSYLVVEDSNVNGHPVYPEFGPGPMEAIERFLATHDEFEVDRGREKFLLTFNPGGYLRRRVDEGAHG